LWPVLVFVVDSAMTRAACIYNPASRNAPAPAVIEELRTRLNKLGYAVQFLGTERPLHATELARNAAASDCDLVLACGGDGTIHEVVSGLALSSVPLAILPSGTANVLARELQLPRNPLKAAALIPQLKPRRIALGKCGDHYFLLMAGVGLDATAIDRVNARWKSSIGRLAYGLAALGSWSEGHFPPLSVCVDGSTFTGTFVVVGRVSRYGGSMRITRNAHLLSDRFDVCLFQGGSRADYLKYSVGVLSGTHHRFRDVMCVSGKNVEITAEQPVGVQLDGELRGWTPVKLEIVLDALTLLVPEDFLGRS
jgi:diacylglycerol kinase (ATP)